MRIILGIVLFLFISFWLAFIISVGVSAGIKNSQTEIKIKQEKNKISFQKKEEKENESI